VKPLLLFSAQVEAKKVVLFLVALRTPLACRYASTENRVVGLGSCNPVAGQVRVVDILVGSQVTRVEPPQNPSV
jgi:hypothetical protein